jgi:penicillin amidase
MAQGYATASDRLWQMDTLRRVAGGDLSEIVGPAALEADRDARRLRLRRTAEEILAKLTPRDKAAFAAYARGVNAYIESHRGRYTFEFTALGYDPKPWSAVDGILASLQMFRTLTNDWKTKIQKQEMLRGGEPEKVQYLFPTRTSWGFAPGFAASLGGDVHPGSNAWAVSGAHTANGKPLVSNDMHLEFSLPGVWYMVHLTVKGRRLNVSGVSLPGLPGVVGGHNDRIAWGLTNLGYEVQDLYEERMDARTGQYVFQQHVEQARQERESIQVKGRQPDEVSLWITRHGPAITVTEGKLTTLKWTGFDASIFHNVFLDINRAGNWDEFQAALSEFGGPPQNFVYADADGNIGYHVGGKLPIRRNYAGDLPVDGASGNFEWDGYIPFADLPHEFNPKSGYIVTANQNPFPADYPYPVSGGFAAPYRATQILNRLQSSGNKLKPVDSLHIQTDVYSSFGKFLAEQLVAVTDKRGGGSQAVGEAAQLLRRWDGQMDKDRPEPLIVMLAFQHLRVAVAERVAPGSGTAYEPQMSTAVVERLLKERPDGWFSDYSELLLRSLAEGIDEGQKLQGLALSRWRWGRSTFADIQHPVGAKIPFIGSYFNVGPVPMSGSQTTVKQTTRRLGPSERMNASVGDWDESLMNIPLGQSGNVASSHYRDQWDSYYGGTSFPMQFNKVAGKCKLVLVPVK